MPCRNEVLIHSAAGGVGLAAVHLCKKVGDDLFGRGKNLWRVFFFGKLFFWSDYLYIMSICIYVYIYIYVYDCFQNHFCFGIMGVLEVKVSEFSEIGRVPQQ